GVASRGQAMAGSGWSAISFVTVSRARSRSTCSRNISGRYLNDLPSRNREQQPLSCKRSSTVAVVVYARPAGSPTHAWISRVVATPRSHSTTMTPYSRVPLTRFTAADTTYVVGAFQSLFQRDRIGNRRCFTAQRLKRDRPSLFHRVGQFVRSHTLFVHLARHHGDRRSRMQNLANGRVYD